MKVYTNSEGKVIVNSEGKALIESENSGGSNIPVKGVDYFTQEDKNELINAILQTELIDNTLV